MIPWSEQVILLYIPVDGVPEIPVYILHLFLFRFDLRKKKTPKFD